MITCDGHTKGTFGHAGAIQERVNAGQNQIPDTHAVETGILLPHLQEKTYPMCAPENRGKFPPVTTDSSLIKAIREYLDRTGLSARRLSLAATDGKNDSLVKAILQGKSKNPRADTIARLAAAMGRSSSDLMPPGEPGSIERDVATFRSEVSAPLDTDAVDRGDLPVHASAEGGRSGAMILSSAPVDWVKRPEPLLHVRRAFACYVLNDSMSPAYEHGDMLLVDPSKPVRGGDDCLFVKSHADGGMDALIKRLIRATADKWRVRQFNPARDFDLSRADWTEAMLVVGKYSRR